MVEIDHFRMQAGLNTFSLQQMKVLEDNSNRNLLKLFHSTPSFPRRIAIEVWLRPIFSAIYFILLPSCRPQST